MTRDDIEDLIYDAAIVCCTSMGLTTASGSVTRGLVDAMSTSVAAAIDDALRARMEPLINALKLLGDQVAEHNKVLRADTPTQVQAPSRWQCYCGYINAADTACRVCDRRHM